MEILTLMAMAYSSVSEEFFADVIGVTMAACPETLPLVIAVADMQVDSP
jgi:hypothetical protein